MATEESTIIPDGIDLNESPFELQAIAGLPFGKNSAEARAIRELLEHPSGEGAAASPWPLPPVEGLPFAKDSDEARAIERGIDQAENEQRKSPRED